MQSRSRRKAAHERKRFNVWGPVAQAAAIVVAVALVYLPALHAGFVWDDEQLITGNPLLSNFAGLSEIWSGGRTADSFPITNTVFWIEHHLFGDNAAGYHAVNVLLQAADAVLVWLVLLRLKVPGAWLAGLIFGIHPVHVESVAWISELKNVLSMFFALASIFCFFAIEEKRLLGSFTEYIASLVFFLLALLSKTQAVFLPVALLLCAWWRGWRSETANSMSFRREVIRPCPFFLIAAVLCLVAIWSQNRGIGDEEIVIGSLTRRFANADMAVWWYAGKVFVPIRLMPIYPKWRFDSPRLEEWLPLIALLSLLVIIWLWRNRGTRGAFFVLACFVVSLLPTLGFVRLAYLRSGTLVADHHQYFADVSFVAFFSAGVVSVWAWRQRGAKIATIAIILLLLGAMGTYTYGRAEIYRSEETLWRDNLSKNPDAWQAQIRMGLLFFKQERDVYAIYHCVRDFELNAELTSRRHLL